MKSENEFNALLGRLLKKLEPHVYKLKVAEKYHTGVSDFFIWKSAKFAALETKFVKQLPARGTTKLLAHPFSGPQLSFLKSITSTGCRGFGAIGLDEAKTITLFPYHIIPATGNWTVSEYLDWKRDFSNEIWVLQGFDIEAVKLMLTKMF